MDEGVLGFFLCRRVGRLRVNGAEGALRCWLFSVLLRVLLDAIARSPSPLLPAPLLEPGSYTPIPPPTMPAADLRLLVLDRSGGHGLSLLLILGRLIAGPRTWWAQGRCTVA